MKTVKKQECKKWNQFRGSRITHWMALLSSRCTAVAFRKGAVTKSTPSELRCDVTSSELREKSRGRIALKLRKYVHTRKNGEGKWPSKTSSFCSDDPLLQSSCQCHSLNLFGVKTEEGGGSAVVALTAPRASLWRTPFFFLCYDTHHFFLVQTDPEGPWIS